MPSAIEAFGGFANTKAALLRKGVAQEEITGHGVRAMAATLLHGIGLWHHDAIERQLAHCDNNAVRRACRLNAESGRQQTVAGWPSAGSSIAWA